jgi:glycosyltransferase involved in cell wall biosynthesis
MHERDWLMKLAILGSRGIPARYGGFETFAERLATGLCRNGFDVTVFCERRGFDQPDDYKEVKLRYVAARLFGPLRTIAYDIRCLWSARKDFDVVYMLGYGAAPFCLIPRLWKRQVWINPDGLEWARAKWGFVAKAYFRLMEWVAVRVATRVIADSKGIADCLSRRHGNLRSCSVIAYGCDVIDATPSVELLSEWNLMQRGYYLVVCRLEPENHVLEILRAFQQSCSSKELVVVGNHLARTRYLEQLRAVQDRRIRMIGPVYDQAKLISLRYHSFAYLHGHSVGGTNPSLLEAMGCANLIVAHDNAFNRETLGDAALFFEGIEDLRETLEKVEGTECDASRMQSEAKCRASHLYSWPSIIEQYASLLGSASMTFPEKVTRARPGWEMPA